MSASGCDVPALVRLLRPLNAAMAAAAVIVGAFVAARPVDWRSAVLGACCAFVASGGANALNDAVDAGSDRVNRPERPVASGSVSPGMAVAVAVVLYAAGIALAAPLGRPALLLACAWALSTALYSLALEKLPLVGNLVVAAVAASPLLMGGFSQGPFARGDRLAVMLVLAMLLHTAREFVKDVEDAAGDAAAMKRTLAVAAGPAVAMAAARALLVVVMWVAVAPYALGLLGAGYAVLLIPIEGMLAWLFVMSAGLGRGDGDARRLRGLSGGLKVVMALGLAAFVAGAC